MSKAAKQIIVILILLLGITAYVSISTLLEKQRLQQQAMALQQEIVAQQDQNKKLAQERQNLTREVETLQNQNTALDERVASLNEGIEQFSLQVGTLEEEREDLRSRVLLVTQERDTLMTRLQERPEMPVASVKPAGGDIPMDKATKELLAKDTEGHWAAVLKEKAALEVELNKYKNEITERAITIGELKKNTSDLELELSALKTEKEDAEKKIENNEHVIDNLSVELARAKNDKSFIKKRLEKVRGENSEFRARIKALTTKKVVLEKNLVKLKDEKRDLEKRLITAEGTLHDQVDELLNIKESIEARQEKRKEKQVPTVAKSNQVELPPIIVSAPQKSPPSVPPGPPTMIPAPQSLGFNGNIISLNQDNNFVIVDLGKSAGIQIGEKLNVYRGDKYVAGLRVIQVRDDICAADIVQKSAKIKVGDTVR